MNFRICIFLTIFMFLTAGAFAQTKIEYPKTKKVEQVDDYHGTKVSDPYRWLEDDNSAETKAWVEAQNKVTFGYLNTIPERAMLKKRLTELWDYEKYSAPFKEGDKYFYYKNDGLQNQAVLYVAESVTDKGRVLLDPNKLSADGTVALSGISLSDDGKILAYGLAASGSDWQEWHFRDVETGKDLPDVLKDIKFSGASWTKDNSGIYYSRYPAVEDAKKLTALNYDQKIYFHKLGTPQTEDYVVYERPDDKELGFGGYVTEDGNWLIISVWKGTSPQSMVYFKNLTMDKAPIMPLVDKFEAAYDFIGNDGSTFYFRTDKDAPLGKIVSVDALIKDKQWKTVVPEAKETLESVGFVNDQFIGEYFKGRIFADPHF